MLVLVSLVILTSTDLAVEQDKRGADFIVADGDEFIADVLGIGTDAAPLTW